MEALRWDAPVELSSAEKRVAKRLKRTGKLFLFLREHRHRLFDDAFQTELASLDSEVLRGSLKPPALLAMVTLLQAYRRTSDADAVEEAVFDARWRMVLGLSNDNDPGFSQGVLVDFRRRLIEHDMDKRLVYRTVELARETGGFGYKHLRVALDSAPLWGAERVEDTFNLVAHAARLVVDCAAHVLACEPEQVRRGAGQVVVADRSVKAVVEIDWSDREVQQEALGRLLSDIGRLRRWLDDNIAVDKRTAPLLEALATLEQAIEQDIEPTPDGGGHRIKRETSANR